MSFAEDPPRDDPEEDPEEVGGCEHGEHPAYDEKGNRRVCEPNSRFCSTECEECEHADFDDSTLCCAGICGFPNRLKPNGDTTW